MNPDLLDCICLYENVCVRNCRMNNRRFPYPSDSRLYTLRFDPSRGDPCRKAFECVERFEERNHRDTDGIEAWSNGLIRIWVRQ